MTSSHRRYIARETSVSIVINMLISALFMSLVFGHNQSIDLWGVHGLALDFVPQTFMISTMSILVPTLITRSRMRGGSIESIRPPTLPVSPRSLWLRVLLAAVILTGLTGGIGIGLLAALSADLLPFWEGFSWKLAYGALVAAMATPIGLVMVLSEDVTPHAAAAKNH